MDALARLEPVAQRLLRDVDALLATLGAPPDHPVWSRLRAVGATPAEAVRFFIRTAPAGLLAGASSLREQERGYAAIAVPVQVAWQGRAGQEYAAHATALADHLHGDASLTSRVGLTASYVDEVAGWLQRSRDRMARALADVLVSAQAVAITAHQPPIATEVVVAAADVGAYLLDAAATAIVEGHELHQAWGSRLGVLPFRAPAVAPAWGEAIIDLRA
jgi:hypothetical protein